MAKTMHIDSKLTQQVIEKIAEKNNISSAKVGNCILDWFVGEMIKEASIRLTIPNDTIEKIELEDLYGIGEFYD